MVPRPVTISPAKSCLGSRASSATHLQRRPPVAIFALSAARLLTLNIRIPHSPSHERLPPLSSATTRVQPISIDYRRNPAICGLKWPGLTGKLPGLCQPPPSRLIRQVLCQHCEPIVEIQFPRGIASGALPLPLLRLPHPTRHSAPLNTLSESSGSTSPFPVVSRNPGPPPIGADGNISVGKPNNRRTRFPACKWHRAQRNATFGTETIAPYPKEPRHVPPPPARSHHVVPHGDSVLGCCHGAGQLEAALQRQGPLRLGDRQRRAEHVHSEGRHDRQHRQADGDDAHRADVRELHHGARMAAHAADGQRGRVHLGRPADARRARRSAAASRCRCSTAAISETYTSHGDVFPHLGRDDEARPAASRNGLAALPAQRAALQAVARVEPLPHHLQRRRAEAGRQRQGSLRRQRVPPAQGLHLPGVGRLRMPLPQPARFRSCLRRIPRPTRSASEAEGFVPLYTGLDLAGWRQADGPRRPLAAEGLGPALRRQERSRRSRTTSTSGPRRSTAISRWSSIGGCRPSR